MCHKPILTYSFCFRACEDKLDVIKHSFPAWFTVTLVLINYLQSSCF